MAIIKDIFNTNGNVYDVQDLQRNELLSNKQSKQGSFLRSDNLFSVARPSWNGTACNNEIIFPTLNTSFLIWQFLIYNVSSWLENPFSKLEVNEEKMFSEDWTKHNRNKMFMQVLLD